MGSHLGATMALVQAAREQLAPAGILRAGINLSNFLLVTGKDSQGQYQGVSPGVAHALAQALNVPLQLIPYPGPGVLADAIVDNVWDIANIACEKERAKTIHFSPAYCENIRNATILRAPSIEESFQMFCDGKYEVLSGLRPRLLSDKERLPGSSILAGCFTVIKQAIGCRKNLPEAAEFLEKFVLEARTSGGLVERLIAEHGVEGRLAVGT